MCVCIPLPPNPQGILALWSFVIKVNNIQIKGNFVKQLQNLGRHLSFLFIISFTCACCQIDKCLVFFFVCLFLLWGPSFSYSWQMMSCIILHNFGPGTWTFLPTVSALVEFSNSPFCINPWSPEYDWWRTEALNNRRGISCRICALLIIAVGHNDSLSAENCAHLECGWLNKYVVTQEKMIVF